MPSPARNSGRITLPPDSATMDELWEWIENIAPQVEALNQTADEVSQLVYDLKLSPKEAALFRVLYGARGRTVLKATLEDAAWGDDWRSSNILTVTIHKLRKKLQNSPYCITAQWGLGYALNAPRASSQSHQQQEQDQ